MKKESPSSVPRHIAIIMDGNGRWAKEQGLQRIRGHQKGTDSVQNCVERCVESGVEFLTLYAFSSENWKRPKAEVSALMKLLEAFIKKKTPELMKQNVRLRAIGRLTDLPASCQKELNKAIETTSKNTALTLILALSYGSRQEIVDGIKNVLHELKQGSLKEEEINPEVFSKYLYTRDYPDPDLLIRTSGELRLSNFLLWQLSYTEMYVTNKLWPDFGKEDLSAAIDAYGKRQRRYGGV